MRSSDAIDDLSVGCCVFQDAPLKLKQFADVACGSRVILRLKKRSRGGVAKGA